MCCGCASVVGVGSEGVCGSEAVCGTGLAVSVSAARSVLFVEVSW